MTGDNTVKVMGWDGTPTNRCDHKDCSNAPIVHFEISSPDSEWSCEADLCEEHLPQVAEQSRAFGVAMGLIAPTSVLDRNILASVQEHAGD